MKDKKIDLQIFSDGGSRGNPGPAAYGFVIYDSNKNVLFKEGKTLGETTNNIAEYSGVKAALLWVVNNVDLATLNHIQVFLDSELVTRQLGGVYRVKNAALKNFFFEIKQLEIKLSYRISYTSIPREKNKEADELVNMALDNKISA